MRPADRVLVELIIAAPIDRVWNALRDRQQIGEWFGWQYPGDDQEFDWVAACSHDHARRDPRDHPARRCPIESSSSRTTSTGRSFASSRSAPATDPSWTGIYDDVLRGLDEVHPAVAVPDRARAETAAAHVVPERPGAGGRRSDAAAGTGDSQHSRRRPSASVTQSRPRTGETLSGEVWFRSAYQLGMTVKEFGDGLLIANTRPTTEKSPNGGGTLLLTTYGLSDASRADLLER